MVGLQLLQAGIALLLAQIIRANFQQHIPSTSGCESFDAPFLSCSEATAR
jgi:hypothetical protein